MNKERGSVVIIISFFIVVFITILGFIVNVGYLSATKNIYENAAEAAAMAGAARLCDGDAIDVAKQIAKENGVNPKYVEVQLGFYDVENEKFYPEGSSDYPEDEYNNAVLVSIQSTENNILGGFLGKEQTQVRAVAVAYLERYGIMSLKENGEVRLQCTSLEHGKVYAQGDIKFPANQIPLLKEASLLAHGEVLECPVINLFPVGTTIQWNSGSPTQLAHTYSGVPELESIKPIDDEYLEKLKEKADIIYTPEDAGTDNIFYGKVDNWSPPFGAPSYFFDLTNVPSQRLIIFFDCSNQGTHPAAVIRPSSGGTGTIPSHTPSSNKISNITFIANCDIFIDEGDKVNDQPYYLHMGAEGTKQVIIISSGNITVYYGNIWFEGVTLRSGADIVFPQSGHAGGDWDNLISTFRNKIRLIADGDVIINYSAPAGHFNFTFGPPCPPVIVKLGKL